MSQESHQKQLGNLIAKLREYVTQPSAFRIFALVVSPTYDTTDMVSKLVEEFKGEYINILTDRLSILQPKLGRYSPADLKKDIGSWSSTDKSLLIVDEIEALLDTWTKEQQQDFFKMISKWRTNSVVLLITYLDLPFEELLSNGRVFQVARKGARC